MHRKFAAWRSGNRGGRSSSALVSRRCRAQGFSPFALVASAAAILVVLFGDSPGAVTRGMTVAVVSFAVATGTLLSIKPAVHRGGRVSRRWRSSGLRCSAVLLKRTGSLTLCFQLAVLGMAWYCWSGCT